MLNKIKFIVAGVATITIGTTVIVICKRKAFRSNRENVYKSLVDDSEIVETINNVEDCAKKVELQKNYMMLLSNVMLANNLKALEESVNTIKEFFDDVVEYLNNQSPMNFEFDEDDAESEQDGENEEDVNENSDNTAPSNVRSFNLNDECDKIYKKYCPDEKTGAPSISDFPIQYTKTPHSSKKTEGTDQPTVTDDYREVKTETEINDIKCFNEIENATEENAATTVDTPSSVTVFNNGDSDSKLEATTSNDTGTYSNEESTTTDSECTDKSDGFTEDTTTEETRGLEDSTQEGSGVYSGNTSESLTGENSSDTNKIITDNQDILTRVSSALEYLLVSDDSEQTKYQRHMFETFIDDLRDVYTIDHDAYDEYFDKLVDIVSIESDDEKLNKLTRTMNRFSREFTNKLKKARKNNFKNR